MTVPHGPGQGKRLSPSALRSFAGATSTLEGMVRDSLRLIEGAMTESPQAMDAYGDLVDNLKIAIDEREMGSLPRISEACRKLLGEQT
jgi:hypothetical protein